jgi:hypothetical protein
VYIARNGNDMVFRDVTNPTEKTLTNLLAGTWDGILPDTIAYPNPVTGIALFNRIQKNYRELHVQDANGSLPAPVQLSIGHRRVGWWNTPGNSTTVTTHGMGHTATGTATARTVATTSLLASLRRVGFVTGNNPGLSAGTRNNALQFCRGGFVGTLYEGGIVYRARFGLPQILAGMRWFVGLTGSAAVIGNVNPSTLTNIVGFGIDAGDTNVQLMQNDAAGTATKTDTGINGRTLNSVFDVFLAVWPDSAVWSCYLKRWDVDQYFDDQVTVDMPAQTQLLSPQIWINTGATTGTVAIDVCQQYIETNL